MVGVMKVMGTSFKRTCAHIVVFSVPDPQQATVLGSKITTDGDCGHEIKRCLLLGGKVMIILDSILKSRDYFADKGPSSQSHGFSSSHVWI